MKEKVDQLGGDGWTICRCDRGFVAVEMRTGIEEERDSADRDG